MAALSALRSAWLVVMLGATLGSGCPYYCTNWCEEGVEFCLRYECTPGLKDSCGQSGKSICEESCEGGLQGGKEMIQKPVEEEFPMRLIYLPVIASLVFGSCCLVLTRYRHFFLAWFTQEKDYDEEAAYRAGQRAAVGNANAADKYVEKHRKDEDAYEANHNQEALAWAHSDHSIEVEELTDLHERHKEHADSMGHVHKKMKHLNDKHEKEIPPHHGQHDHRQAICENDVKHTQQRGVIKANGGQRQELQECADALELTSVRLKDGTMVVDGVFLDEQGNKTYQMPAGFKYQHFSAQSIQDPDAPERIGKAQADRKDDQATAGPRYDGVVAEAHHKHHHGGYHDPTVIETVEKKVPEGQASKVSPKGSARGSKISPKGSARGSKHHHHHHHGDAAAA